MKNLVRLKIAVAELKQLRESEQMSEKAYNKELRKILREYQALKMRSHEQDLRQEVVEITIEPLQYYFSS